MDTMLATFVDQFADSLVDAVLDALKPRIEAKLREALPQVLPQIAPPKAPEVIPASHSKPKVGVTGLLPQQAGMIATEFGDTFDLRFWNDRNGDGVKQLKSMGVGCEIVFWNTGFCAHGTEAMLRNTGAKVVNFGGGMTQLRDLLTEYYVEVSA